MQARGDATVLQRWLGAEPGEIEDRLDEVMPWLAGAPYVVTALVEGLSTSSPARLANARLLLCLLGPDSLVAIARGFDHDDPTVRDMLLGVLWSHLIVMTPGDRSAALESIAPLLRPGLRDLRVPDRGFAQPDLVEPEPVWRVSDATYLFLNRLSDRGFDDSVFVLLDPQARADTVAQFDRRFEQLFATPVAQARKAARSPAALSEITVVASFPDPYGGQDTQQERDMSAQAKWAPSTRDFLAVAQVDTPEPARAVFQARSFLEFIAAVLYERPAQPDRSPYRPAQSLRRLNLITHGNSGLIALAGTVDRSGTVMLQVRAPGGDDLSGGIDAAAVQTASNPMLLLGDGKGLVQMLRDRFAPDAEFYLYACHSGMAGSLPLVHDLQALLKVRIRAFTSEIAYCPAIDATRIVDRAYTAVGTCNNGSNRGFRHLTPDISVGAARTSPGAGGAGGT